jgi:hypothetical protein
MSSAVDGFVVDGVECYQNLGGYRVELIDRARDAPLHEATLKRRATGATVEADERRLG